METDPNIVAKLASQQGDENWRFRTFLNHRLRLRPAKIHALAQRIGREAEAQMDCTTCAACCRGNTVPVNEAEAQRLADRLELSEQAFCEQYLTTDLYGEPAIDATPCPLLDGTKCSVYDARPDACRGYPYIDGTISQQIVGLIERVPDCPIVYEMLERLKAELGFNKVK